jgi:hypothetical protein
MKKQFLNYSIIRLTVLTVLLGLFSTTALAQVQYENQVRFQLDVIKALTEEKGFEKTHNYKIDKLKNSGTDNFYLTLRKGWEYLLVSACDKDCTDIDIRIFDENDNLIVEDLKRDDLAAVKVTPKWTGEFRIQVTMYRCYDSPCYYGIGVFGK